MNQDQRRVVGEAMLARAQQWRLRVAIGTLVTFLFFTTAGLVFAFSWLAFYACLQLVELRVFRGKRQNPATGWSTSWCWFATGFVSFNNLVFGAFAVKQAFSGHALALISAALIITGAMINGVIVSAGSRHLTWASISPQVLCFFGLLLATVTPGQSLFMTAQVAGASILFVLGVGSTSFQLTTKLRNVDAAQRAAEKASIAKTEFLANMSHEIRTPLNGVVSMAEMLARSPLSESDREKVEIILSSGEALTGLLSDILDMSRIEAGEIVLEDAPYHLGDTLRAACALYRLRADEKGISLALDMQAETDRVVSGDAARLRQILNNLISNAVKFTVAGQVSVSARLLDDGRVRLQVSDSGIGFDLAEGTDIFARFQQADGSITRRFGGSGLGLSICRDLATLMGGAISCSSQSGIGSNFWADLPFVPSAGQVAVPSGPYVADVAGPARPLKILVADDHSVNLKVVSLILGQMGAEAVLVENGAEAVEAFKAQPFDVILMDMQMPVMDGLTAIREIRASERLSGTPRTPIAMLSANALAEHVASAMAAGADLHVAKPIKTGELMLAIQRLAGEHESASPDEAALSVGVA